MEYFYNQCNRFYRSAIGINIEIVNELDNNKMGIYKIWFGEKYYIGSSKNITRRKSSHINTLNKLINNMHTGAASNYNILKHLFINLDITCGYMELLQEVENEEDLSKIEAMYILDFDNDENSLNYSSRATRPTKSKKVNPIAIAVADTLLNSIGECVFRLYCNEKYVIIKGKSLVGSLSMVNSAMENFSKKDRSEWLVDHLYYHFIGYIFDQTEEVEYSASLLAMTRNPYDLLKVEQMQLWENATDPNCLNNSFDAYIPEYKEETGMYGWINRGQYAAFMKWKYLNMPQPQEPANCVPSIHEHNLSPVAVVLSEKDNALRLSLYGHQQTQKSAFCQETFWQPLLKLTA
jgi:hypothetical protein